MASGPGSATLTVLLIDEDPASGRVVRAALVPPRYTTAVATRPLDGLRLAARQKPQLVLMELHFSQGNGLELARKLMLAPETRGSAVVFFSAERSVAARLQALQAGAAGFIGKPIEGARLSQRLDEIVQGLYSHGLPHDVSQMPGANELLTQLRGVEQSGKAVTIEAVAAGSNARISLAGGQLLDVQLDGRRGEPALEALARRGDWQVALAGRSTPAPLAAEPAFGGAVDVPDEEATMIEGAGAPDPMKTTEVPTGSEPWRQQLGELGAPQDAMAPDDAFGLEPFDEDDEDERTQAAGMPIFANANASRPAAPTPRPPPVAPQPVVAVSPPRGFAPPTRPSSLAPAPEPPPEDDELAGFEEDEPTRQAAARFRPIVDDDPAPEVVVPAAQLGMQGAAAMAMVSGPEARQAWLDAMGKPPLLVVIPDRTARTVFEATARQQGYIPLVATSGATAYRAILEHRPAAVICDAALPDAEGKALLAGIRCDFRVRETPFIIIDVAGMTAVLNQAGAAAVKPMFDGLAMALTPRCELFAGLQAERPEVSGWVEPVGTVQLLQTLGAAKVSGRLSLRVGETRSAEVIFGRGEVCGVTVNAPQLAVGPLAMLQLIGFEWQEFVFVREAADAGRVPLGDLQALVRTACDQNNVLLARVHAEGLTMPEVQVDRGCLDGYLVEQPPQRYELLIRLVEGEPALALAEAKVAPDAALKSVLFELRRKAVIRPQSLRPTRGEGIEWLVFEASALAAPPPELAVPKPVRGPRRRRWPVVVAACLMTVVLAAGGFFVYRYIKVDGQLDRVLPWTSSSE
jgi:CheY-like chemotaxis protein